MPFPLGGHLFPPTGTIFKLIQDIIRTNRLTKFHDDRTINVASREKCLAPGGHVFKATETIFELIQDFIRTNLLNKFHKDRKIDVASIVLTRTNSPPPGDIIGINLLTKFHEDRTINENAPPLGNQSSEQFHEDWTINANVDAAQRTTHDGRRTKGNHKSSP
ncbi:hypothetical protein DPMN_094767 [Dreissena polymorpha]|uniref:Uncharacterized protein n=1 Tax=Dreissena polymorpha TaxID=45954 RepID=A0A9D4L6M2_DREPO|nr:hypothetical protein DPMN_094767 [Dreissena polymorpha]